MSDLFWLSWRRLLRQRFLWLLVALSVLAAGGFFFLSRWQTVLENQTIIRQLDTNSTTLSVQLLDVPRKPDTIPKEQVLFWAIVDAKTQLLTHIHRASEAKQQGDEVAYTREHLAMLQAIAQLKRVNPEEAKNYLPSDVKSLPIEIRIDRQLVRSGQTRVNPRSSMAPAVLILRLLEIIMFPPILAFVMMTLNWLWRDTFNASAQQFLLHQVKNRSQLVGENLITTIALVIVMLGSTIMTILILTWLLPSQEQVFWRYPLSLTNSVLQQLISVGSIGSMLSIGIIGLTQLTPLLIRGISVQIAFVVGGVAGLTFIPWAHAFNPFNALATTFLAWKEPVPLGLISVAAVWSLLNVFFAVILLNHYYPATSEQSAS